MREIARLTGSLRASRIGCDNREWPGLVMLDRTGGEQTFALATTGAVPPWKVKSGRSTCGNTRIRANKNSSNPSRVQRHHFIRKETYPITRTLSTQSLFAQIGPGTAVDARAYIDSATSKTTATPRPKSSTKGKSKPERTWLEGSSIARASLEVSLDNADTVIDGARSNETILQKRVMNP